MGVPNQWTIGFNKKKLGNNFIQIKVKERMINAVTTARPIRLRIYFHI